MTLPAPNPVNPVFAQDTRTFSPTWFNWFMELYRSLVSGSAALSGVFVNNVVVVAGTPVTVTHNLGRSILGWIIIRGGPIDVTEVSDDSTTLVLQGGADSGTIGLWVF